MTVVSGCSAGRGAPDREETFAVQGGECTEPQEDDVPAAASDAAAEALAAATVDASELAAWMTTILESRSTDQEIAETSLEGYAYIEAVRAEVRAGLSKAGFPDAPTRIIEAFSNVECS